MPDSIRDLIADTLHGITRVPTTMTADEIDEMLADAILAHPDIQAIIDLAAHWYCEGPWMNPSDEVLALLADWRNQ